MNVFMNKTDISGIKNLKEMVTLNYYKATVGKEISLDRTNIKAIYGPNAAGKSAIVHAYDIYHDLVGKTGWLFNQPFISKLNELINKEIGIFFIGINFILFNNNEFVSEYRHEITIGKTAESYQFKKEKLIQVKSRSQSTIVEIENGLIKSSVFSKDIVSAVSNQLLDRSIVDLVAKLYSSPIRKLNDDDLKHIRPFIFFANNLCVETADEEKSFEYMPKNKDFVDQDFQMQDLFLQQLSEPVGRYSFVIHQNELAKFEAYVANLARFIKLFKPDLKKIDISSKILNADEIHIEPYFVYDKAHIHLKFESAGIKKLVNLYRLFCLKEAGKIVIIDELDANINDIYLLRLLEYFNLNPVGQLIFTTHNVTPMQVLSNNKFGLDFLTLSGKITPWVKVGNYSPINLYQKGYIKGLPFNIYVSDFLGVFADE